MSSKGNPARPSVTDWDFDIRVPNFLTLHGHVLHTIARINKTERILEPGQVVKYRRHGSFELCYAGDDHAVIKHTTLTGEVMHLFVPERKLLSVSDGSYRTSDVAYERCQRDYQHLKDKPRVQPVYVFLIEKLPPLQMHGVFHEGMYDKYHTLFDAFSGYWKENFAECVQEDVDSHTFQLGARIRYGLSCVLDGKPVPDDCDYEKLVKEVDSWIDYREGR